MSMELPENHQQLQSALSYLEQVKLKFHEQPQVLKNFVDIMKDFKSQTTDTPGVITRVSNLFKEYPELIVGFYEFLPQEHEIQLQEYEIEIEIPEIKMEVPEIIVEVPEIKQKSQERKHEEYIDFIHAINYINKIKTRFSNQPYKYRRFLEILQTYQNGLKDNGDTSTFCPKAVEEVYAQIAEVFDYQNDILVEFEQFLPK